MKPGPETWPQIMRRLHHAIEACRYLLDHQYERAERLARKAIKPEPREPRS
jgi:hypothetical protein